MKSEIRIHYNVIFEQLKRILSLRGFDENDSELSAKLFTSSSCDGFYSHGLNRFHAYIDNIDSGIIKVGMKPKRIRRHGAFEQWDGQFAPGNLNAWFSMNRAVEISREHGLGCVALKQTNHWLRGGSDGWQAADNGCSAILWSNTTANMAPWGGVEPKIGNNPLILAVPRASGHVVLDFAQSMYSYGKMSQYKKRGESMPLMAGYDIDGNLSNDPAAIEESMSSLPAGLWKGSGLSILLDLIAVFLAGGKSSMDISKMDDETDLSQVFIAFSPDNNVSNSLNDRFDHIIEHIKNTRRVAENGQIYYPGERTLNTRNENLEKGIPVDPDIWNNIQCL